MSIRGCRAWVVLVVAAVLGAGASDLGAHDLTDRRVTGTEVACEVRVCRDRLNFDYWIAVGDIAAVDFRRKIDVDGNGKIDPTEKLKIEAMLQERITREGFFLELDEDHKADRLLVFDRLRSSIKDFENTGEPNPLKINFQLHLPIDQLPLGKHEVGFYPRNIMDLPAKTRVLVVGAEGVNLAFIHPEDVESLKQGIARGAMEPTGLPFDFELTSASRVWAPTEEPAQIDTTIEERMKELVRLEDPSTWMIVLAIGIAFLYGGAHALSPGHGKSLMAAYLIGKHGTIWNAVVLGVTVTVAHTSIVIIAGGVALYYSNYLYGAMEFWLNMASGGMIVVIGLSIFRARLLGTSALFEHTHGPGGHHHHPGQDHDHDPVHTHDHDHAHDHEVGPPDVSRALSWRGMIPVGISGGAIPCPTAVVALMYAVHLRKIAWGMALILSFSVGLGIVLAAIGILVVRAASVLDRFSGTGKLLRVLPVLSALFITCIGGVILYTTYQARGYVSSTPEVVSQPK